jgi:CRISPR-associated endonuclease/helicase Cas3
VTLSPDDFAAFFKGIHGHDPFPWQQRLLKTIAADGHWPPVLDIPTGAGKTAAIDVAVFHLALEALSGPQRLAPVRIAMVVDRRLVVDDAFEHAKKLANALVGGAGPVLTRVAERLKQLAGDGPPLIARRLRGGIPREDDWARTPSQPTVLCSTVDQIGSRLLFRAYGVSDPMKPVQAGLIGSDCLILLDEAHLAEPFRQTLQWVATYRHERWRQNKAAAPWAVASLSATPWASAEHRFTLSDDDRAHLVLSRRLLASKPARLVVPPKSRRKIPQDKEPARDDSDHGEREEERRRATLVEEARKAMAHFGNREHGVPAPAIGIVVNRVARARAVFELLRKELGGQIGNGRAPEAVLMIGPARPLDRDELTSVLNPVRTRHWVENEVRALETPMFVVATQCLEVGVDIDLDGLITEIAPLDALRQRFGRLNRAGRRIIPYAAVVADSADLARQARDPVYGAAIKSTWDYLTAQAAAQPGALTRFDFGVDALDRLLQKSPVPVDTVAEKPDAPVLLPAHLDLLSQTAPVPSADPEIALYLHGPRRQPDSVTVVWRADVSPTLGAENSRRLLLLAPPRLTEAIELPVWSVREWLRGTPRASDALADVASAHDDDGGRPVRELSGRRIFRWKGDDESSQWVLAGELRPGDTIVAPAEYGGADRFGWNPESTATVTDLGSLSAAPFAGRRFTVRVAPGLVGPSVADGALAKAIAAAETERWKDVRAALLGLDLPDTIRTDLLALDRARRNKISLYSDVYGSDAEGRPRGFVFQSPLGITGKSMAAGDYMSFSEDDASGSLTGVSVSLAAHSRDVESLAESFSRSAGLSPERVGDLKVAGRLHDLGKTDARFQAWLHYGDPLGPDPTEVLAKSGRHLPRAAREASTLPKRWRHEALSVRLACMSSELKDASDPDLVLWLIGTHHGHGRPLFPHHDPLEDGADVGPQSLRFGWNGLDWPMLFETLKARYGVWELARMEAVLRLADHRASEARAETERVR